MADTPPWVKYAAQAAGANSGGDVPPWVKYGGSAQPQMSSEMKLNLVRNASPTQFEVERNPVFQPGWRGAVADFASGAIRGIPQMFQMAQSPQERMAQGQSPDQNPAYQAGRQASIEDQRRKAAGASTGYRAAAVAAGPLVNVPAVEHAADVGDTGAIYGNTAPPVALTAAPLAAKAIRGAASGVSSLADAGSSLRGSIADKIINTTPERIAELKAFPAKVEAVRQTVVAAEDAAHKAASASFPQFDKPIPTGKMIQGRTEGPILSDEFGESSPKGLKPETVTWNDLQEQRSGLLKQIADEKRAVMRGAAPRFDLADMYGKLKDVDALMTKAAIEQGGQQGLAQLQAARQQFSKYMQDFHNPGSPLRGILESKPGETAAIVRKLQSPDGARSLEALRANGVNTAPIEQMLSRGQKPVAIDLNESAKLRKAGSPESYRAQRLQEAIRQLRVNELPSGAQERVPAKYLRSKWPSVLGEVPMANVANPRSLTRIFLERELKRGQ